MSNGPGFRARVAGMAPKVLQAALNAALRALVLGLALGRAEDDIEVGLVYIKAFAAAGSALRQSWYRATDLAVRATFSSWRGRVLATWLLSSLVSFGGCRP